MLNREERRSLDLIVQQLTAADPRFGSRMALLERMHRRMCEDPRRRWHEPVAAVSALAALLCLALHDGGATPAAAPAAALALAALLHRRPRRGRGRRPVRQNQPWRGAD
jgi:hypothetical protein